jgi:LysM repeat protein
VTSSLTLIGRTAVVAVCFAAGTGLGLGWRQGWFPVRWIQPETGTLLSVGNSVGESSSPDEPPPPEPEWANWQGPASATGRQPATLPQQFEPAPTDHRPSSSVLHDQDLHGDVLHHATPRGEVIRDATGSAHRQPAEPVTLPHHPLPSAADADEPQAFRRSTRSPSSQRMPIADTRPRSSDPASALAETGPIGARQANPGRTVDSGRARELEFQPQAPGVEKLDEGLRTAETTFTDRVAARSPVVTVAATDPAITGRGAIDRAATDHVSVRGAGPAGVVHAVAEVSPMAARSPKGVRGQPALIADDAAAEFNSATTATTTATKNAGEPSSSSSLEDLLEQIDAQFSRGQVLAAHKQLSQLYWDQPECRPQLMPRLERAAQQIFFSPQPHFVDPYVIQPGDRLQTIAQRYRVTWEYLASLNRMDARRIRADQRLKVLRGPFAALVELHNFTLTIHLQGYFVRQYRVGTGKDGSSPHGRFTVLAKVVDPQYTDPEGRVIAGGAAENPLGRRWIDLGDSYGIHGTIEPDSIGTASSRGCIRLSDQDVIEVYNFLVEGSEVVLRP